MNAIDERWRVLPPGFDWSSVTLEHAVTQGLYLSRARVGKRPDAGTRQRLMESLGLSPLPKRTPLRARVTGRAARTGYRVENLLFQSLPGFHVTANLYLPDKAARRAPAVLCPVGHSMDEGKNAAQVQACCGSMARRGYVVLAYDAIGQGERKTAGNEHINGLSLLLTGRTVAGHMVWDSMRALDYLESRREVDAAHIGVAGCCGGGLNAFYLAAIDDRVQAAVVACFLRSYAGLLSCRQEQCACNHVPGVMQYAEQWDIVALARKIPFMFINDTRDPMFPIEGARQTYRESRRLYGRRGDRVRLVECDTGHCGDRPMREAMYGWMDLWLRKQGDGSPVAEALPEREARAGADFLALKGKRPPRSFETLRSLGEKAAAKRARPRSSGLRERLRGILALGALAAARVEDRGGFESDGLRVWRAVYYSEPGIPIPCLLMERGSQPREKVLVYVNDKGKEAAREDKAAQAALAAGATVLALDLRGFGETAHNEYLVASDGVVLGKPLLGRRVFDILVGLRSFEPLLRPRRVFLMGRGATCSLVAWFAAALDDSIERAAAQGGIVSYRQVAGEPGKQPSGIFVPGLLREFDLPDVAGLLKGRLSVFAPVDARGKPLTGPAARKMLGRAVPIEVGARAERALAEWAKRVAAEA